MLRPFPMLRRLLRLGALAAALLPLGAAALDVNAASRAELEQLKGIGVAMAQRMIDERERRAFADWADLQRRVPGVRPRTLSDQGLRVDGAPYRVSAK